MYAAKFKYHISISILAAFVVFATVLIRYDQNMSELNQDKLLPETFSRIYFSFLSQQVREFYNVDNVSDNVFSSALSLEIKKYFLIISKKDSQDQTHESTPPHLLPCDQGPYIWDRMQHFEGIGSEFQWHKPSFLATHFLHGK